MCLWTCKRTNKLFPFHSAISQGTGVPAGVDITIWDLSQHHSEVIIAVSLEKLQALVSKPMYELNRCQ